MVKLIADNKKARFDYELVEKFEAGLVLKGSEVKSLRAGQCSLKESYISFSKGEAFLQKAHISVYQASSYNNHDPERLRKLLLHREEIRKILIATTEKGMACVPTKIYFKKGYVKIEIALGRGKSKGDKRQTTKKREAARQISSALKKNRS